MNGTPDIHLTRTILSTSRMIARGRGIRDIRRLMRQYGGVERNWIKKSSTILYIQGRRAELHWYEQQGVGRFEIKIKWMD